MDQGPTRAALYIDFDNFFGGLIAVDPKAALDVAQRPSLWVERLRTAHSHGGRRWLVLRCYMNPAGWVPHPTDQGERLYFSKYRPFFTQAGFEIVDCPSLTRGAKNGADIRMTVDIMTALRAVTRYDEVVIASSDSDFTHLLQVVRADDRRIVMIATSGTAAAYQSLADTYLDEQDVLDLMHEPDDGDELTEASASDPADIVPGLSPSSDIPEVSAEAVDWDSFTREVRSAYDSAVEPLNLAGWAAMLHHRFGQGLSEGRWFGAGGFARALERVGLPSLRLSQHFAWDTSRHQAPADRVSPVAVVGPPADVARFCEIAKLPRIPSDRWPVIFRTLADYATLHEFQLSESTRWSRDHAAGQGIDIARSAFLYVVRGCVNGGEPLNAEPPPTVDRIGEALLRSVLEGASRAGLDVTDDERAALRTWLRVDDVS